MAGIKAVFARVKALLALLPSKLKALFLTLRARFLAFLIYIPSKVKSKLTFILALVEIVVTLSFVVVSGNPEMAASLVVGGILLVISFIRNGTILDQVKTVSVVGLGLWFGAWAITNSVKATYPLILPLAMSGAILVVTSVAILFIYRTIRIFVWKFSFIQRAIDPYLDHLAAWLDVMLS